MKITGYPHHARVVCTPRTPSAGRVTNIWRGYYGLYLFDDHADEKGIDAVKGETNDHFRE